MYSLSVLINVLYFFVKKTTEDDKEVGIYVTKFNTMINLIIGIILIVMLIVNSKRNIFWNDEYKYLVWVFGIINLLIGILNQTFLK
jgi:hypothetical protein